MDDIKQYKNYIARQSHNIEKIKAAGFEQWYKDIQPRIDWNRMDTPISKHKETLQRVYNEVIAGVYDIETPNGVIGTDFRVGANVADKVSQSRSLIFKRDQWFDYNQKYGHATLAASYLKALDRAGQTSALMRVLGVNPEATLTRAMEAMQSELMITNPTAAAKLIQKKSLILGNLEILDGRAQIAGNINFAKIASNVRLLQSMSKLGAAVFASTADLAVYGANTRYEGRGNMFKGIGEAVSGLVSRNKGNAREEILNGLDVVFDHTIANIMQQFTKHGNFTDNLSAATRVYTKMNLQVPWTTSLQKSAAIGLSNYIGNNAAKTFDALSDDMKRMFKIHSIDRAKWDVIRKTVNEAEDGRLYIDVRAIQDLPNEAIAGFITANWRTVTDVSIARAKESIATDLRSMFIDRAESAVPSTDKRVQAAMTGRTQRGTLWGEIVRSIGQFKSFPNPILLLGCQGNIGSNLNLRELRLRKIPLVDQIRYWVIITINF
jgi:hypothetical protein